MAILITAFHFLSGSCRPPSLKLELIAGSAQLQRCREGLGPAVVSQTESFMRGTLPLFQIENKETILGLQE